MLAIFMSISAQSMSQAVIAQQDFDGGTPDWSYASDVPFFDNGSDGFFGVSANWNPPLEYSGLAGNILFENDLDDEGDNGTTGFANVTFADVDVTGYTAVTVGFDYDIEGYNANNDEVLYEIFLDGVGQGQVTLQDGENEGDDAEGTVSEAIPSGTTMVGLVVSIRNNGTSGYSGFDNFSVMGTLEGGATEVSFASVAADTGEDAGAYEVCVSIVNEDAQVATTVDVALTGGTATDGADITTYTTQTLTFPAGSADQQCATVMITDDMEIDEGETLEFTLENPMGGSAAAIGLNATTTITIIDNDVLACDAPTWTVVSPSPIEEWEATGTGFEANGFCGGGCEQDVQTWLIYGPLDMSATDFLELSFTAVEAFGVTDLDVKYSADAGANACPDEAAWTSVGMITDGGDFAFDFGAATATEVWIGIEYNDPGNGDGYSRWTLDNFALGADACPTVGVAVQPTVSAGDDVVQCGLSDIALNGEGDGLWTGGAGSFDDATSPTATYTPDASEEGSTVVLTYTLDLAACAGFSDDVSLTFFEVPGDTEFSYGATDFCPTNEIIVPTHTTGVDGIYTVTMGEAADVALDPATGAIDLATTVSGTYEITNTIAGCGNIVITGAIDGPLPGGQPKAVEFYAMDYIPDLSAYSFGSANNGNGGGVEEFIFPADEIQAGTFFYLTANFGDFVSFFGFEPDYTNNSATINGDDALELFCNSQVVDVFGDINMDGSGEAWDYLDGWAYRVSDSAPNVGSWDDAQFTYSGVNALDGETTNATAATPFPLGTFTTTMEGLCPNSSTSMVLNIGDTEGPIVDCPGDILVALDAGACEAVVDYEISFFDNCDTPDTMATIEQTSGMLSGEFYPIGTTTNTFIVTDINGNTTECSFDVVVSEFVSTNASLACNQTINLSLDQNCELVLFADQFLEGNNHGCYNDYEIFINPFGNEGNQFGPFTDAPTVALPEGTHTYEVRDPDTGVSCWGTLNIEGKLPPVFEECACPVGGSLIELPFTGTLDENSPIWTRPFVGGAGCNPSGVGVDIPYATHNFAISMDDNVNAEQVTFTAPSGDGFLALYEETFDPADPCGI